MHARRKEHRAYLQIEYGDTGQLIDALNHKLGENNFRLTMKGSNRWLISTDRKLTDAELNEIREQSVKDLDSPVERDDAPIHSSIGRTATFRTTFLPSNPGRKRTYSWKTLITVARFINPFPPKIGGRSQEGSNPSTPSTGSAVTVH